MDDKESFPTAGAHLIPVGRDISLTYLRHKEAILAQLTEVYLSTSKILPDDRRDAAKALINSLEMDGTFEGWKTRYGIPVQRSATKCSVYLGDGTTFRLSDFIAAQPARTQWLVNKCPRMFELVAGAKNQNQRSPGTHTIIVCAPGTRGAFAECENLLGRGTWPRVVLAAARRGGHGVSGDNTQTGKNGPHGCVLGSAGLYTEGRCETDATAPGYIKNGVGRAAGAHTSTGKNYPVKATRS
jgi:hypothetical protein